MKPKTLKAWKTVTIKMKNKIIPMLLALLAVSPLTLSALAEAESSQATEQNMLPLIIITASIVLLSVVCVILANKKSAKYRKAFKRQKKSNKKK